MIEAMKRASRAMPRRMLWGLLAAGGIVAIATGTARADEYAKLKALLPPAPGGAQACYARTYDTAHLAEHPKQTVTEMIFSLRYTVLGEDEAHLVATEDGVEKQYFDYDFTLAAKVRDRRETLYASGNCTSLEGIGCGVDCDGGGVVIEPVPDADDTILVRLDRSYSYIRMSLGCSEGETVELRAGEDDKVFRLAKAPAALCNAVEADARK